MRTVNKPPSSGAPLILLLLWFSVSDQTKQPIKCLVNQSDQSEDRPSTVFCTHIPTVSTLNQMSSDCVYEPMMSGGERVEAGLALVTTELVMKMFLLTDSLK